MLPEQSLPMPPEWRELPEELAPVFARRSTRRLFMALACGLILADRGTVTRMAAAAGIGQQWRRACWLFAEAKWDLDALGLAVARLIVKYLLSEGAPVTVAVDGTFFRRRGRHVFGARWAYDGSAQGGKKIAFGNTWVVLALVVKLPFCPSPVALPALSRLWRGKGTASHVELAAQMLKALAGAFPGRQIHGTGDAAFHGEVPGHQGNDADDAAASQRGAVRAAAAAGRETRSACGHGRPDRDLRRCRAGRRLDGHGHLGPTGRTSACRSPRARRCGTAASSPPGQLVLVRDPDSVRPYDPGIFTLDTKASPEALAERCSWRWPIEPSNAAGKQLTGAGDACNRTQKAVERTVPFAFLIQSLMILWYARSCDPAASIGHRRSRCPWYRTKATPAPADMHAALRGALTTARINGIRATHSNPPQNTYGALTSDTLAA